jgi:hypothetical protein
MARKKTDWSLETIKPLAKQCKSRTEFVNKFNTAYKHSLKLGIIETLFPKKEYSKEEYSVEYLLKFKTRSELCKKNVRRYLKYKNKNIGLLDKYLPSQKRGCKGKEIVLKTNKTDKVFVERKPMEFWTFEKLKTVIAECGTLSELNKKYRGAYNFGKKNGFI